MVPEILIIDENSSRLKNLSVFLNHSQFLVSISSNGAEALNIAKEKSPKIILCSDENESMSAAQILSLSKNDQFLRGCIFIVYGINELSKYREYLDLGADDYLTTPLNMPALLQCLKMRWQIYSSRVNQTIEIKTDANSLDDLKQFATKTLVFETNQFIFNAGTPARYLFYLLEGKAKSRLLDEDGNELITSFFKKGDLMGFKPLIEERAYHKDGIALENCKVLLIPKSELLKLIDTKSEIAKSVIYQLSSQYTETEEDLLNVAYSNVKTRVAKKLLSIHSIELKETIEITREDFANLIGTSTETLVRSLTELRKEGLISTKGSKIFLKNIDKLKSAYQ